MIKVKNIWGEVNEVDEKELTIRICVYGVIIKEGKILISPQWVENGFDFPGGHVEIGEDHLAGLVREIFEETGLKAKPLDVIVAHTSFFIHPRTNKPQQNLKLYYSAEIIGGKISTQNFDEGEKTYAKEAKFVTLEELKQMRFMCADQEPLAPILKYLETKLKQQKGK